MRSQAHSAVSFVSFIRRSPLVLSSVTVGVAMGIRLALDPWLGDQAQYAMLLVAIVASGVYGNTRAAVESYDIVRISLTLPREMRHLRQRCRDAAIATDHEWHGFSAHHRFA